MEKKQFKITINAPKEKVWNTLWNDATYREWTAAFAEGSRAETDWQKGSKVLFLDAKNSGMVSTIAENKSNEFMSIKHLGIIKEGVEDLDNAESKQWAGAFENYTLQTVKGSTELTVDMGGADIPKEFMDYFIMAWPKALEKLKELAEKN
ncbi:MAG: Activator of Hsp90 ATPase 1 family protein [Chitinophagaceae bacterium]|nr:Activator of Hsp90 ATPase 1 family protein [Chitinophagaceae bacterium]